MLQYTVKHYFIDLRSGNFKRSKCHCLYYYYFFFLFFFFIVVASTTRLGHITTSYNMLKKTEDSNKELDLKEAKQDRIKMQDEYSGTSLHCSRFHSILFAFFLVPEIIPYKQYYFFLAQLIP